MSRSEKSPWPQLPDDLTPYSCTASAHIRWGAVFTTLIGTIRANDQACRRRSIAPAGSRDS